MIEQQSTPTSTSGWLTSKEAAAYLKIPPRTLLQWAREGWIQGYILHGAKRHVWRFRKENLDAALVLAAHSTDPMLSSVKSSTVLQRGGLQ